MGAILKSIFSVGDYIVTGLLIVCLLAVIPVLFLSRNNILVKIKEKIASKDYVRLIIIFLFVATAFTIALNKTTYNLGLAKERFWIVQDYLLSFFFILSSVELLIKKKKLLTEAKIKFKEYGFGLLLFVAVWYLLGAVIIGYALVGE